MLKFLCFILCTVLLLFSKGIKAEDAEAQALLLPVFLSIPGLDDGVVYGLSGGAIAIGEGDYTLMTGAVSGGLKGGGLALMGPGFGENSELSTFAAYIDSATLLQSFTRGLEDPSFVRQQLSGYALGFTYGHTFYSFLSFGFGLLFSQLSFEGYQNTDGDEIIPSDRIRQSTTLLPSLNLGLDFTDSKPIPTSGIKFNIGIDFLMPDKSSLGTQSTLSSGTTLYIPLGTSLVNLVLVARRNDAFVVDKAFYNTPERIREAFVKPLCEEVENAQLQECIELEQQIVDFTLATNQKGVSAPVGGVTGGRGFTLFRFKAAHTALEVAELRWDISTTFTSNPAVLIYATLFHDWVHADDRSSKLYTRSANSYGGGFMALIENISLRLEYAQSIEDSFLYFTAGSNW